MINGSFFDLPHVFIVFHPGSGGNFVSGIFNRVIHNDSTSLPINLEGSSHTVDTPYMSFGVTPDEQILFDNRECREHYYLEQIKREYKDVDRALVTWTHDFSNIEFYRKYFKKCKIVCITATSKEEMLSSIFMNVNKMMLADPVVWPIHPKIKKFRSNRLDKWTKYTLSKMLKSEFSNSIDMIYNSRHDNQYRPIVKLAVIHLLLGQMGLLHYVNPNQYSEHEVFNHVSYPNINSSSSMKYIIGPHVNNYIALADVSLPYNYLATHNVDLLVSTVSTILERELSQNEIEFIHSSFAKYISSQNSLVLSDPIQYYNTIKEECSNLIISN
jgi:hypothetical protein